MLGKCTITEMCSHDMSLGDDGICNLSSVITTKLQVYSCEERKLLRHKHASLLL